MKAVQRELSFPVPLTASKDAKKASSKRKHLMIKGRPRRLRSAFPKLAPAQWEEINRGLAEGLTAEEAVKAFVEEPEVIKVAIPPATIEVLDRIRTRLAGNSTRPEIVRMTVAEFVERHKSLIGEPAKPREKRKVEPGRCEYVKVPFPPQLVRMIGHQEWREIIEEGGLLGERRSIDYPASGLCAVFGCTRQGLIIRAINSWMEEVR